MDNTHGGHRGHFGPTMYFQQCVNYGKALLAAIAVQRGSKIRGVFSRFSLARYFNRKQKQEF